jgi:hypothetical protein
MLIISIDLSLFCAREPTASWSEGGSPKRNPEGDEGDLCLLHKGLAEFLKIEEWTFTSV